MLIFVLQASWPVTKVNTILRGGPGPPIRESTMKKTVELHKRAAADYRHCLFPEMTVPPAAAAGASIPRESIARSAVTTCIAPRSGVFCRAALSNTSRTFSANSAVRKGFRKSGSPSPIRVEVPSIYPDINSTFSFGLRLRASSASCTPFIPPGSTTSLKSRSNVVSASRCLSAVRLSGASSRT